MPYIGLPAVRPGTRPVPAVHGAAPDPGDPARTTRPVPAATFASPAPTAQADDAEEKVATVTPLAARPAQLESAASPPRNGGAFRPSPADLAAQQPKKPDSRRKHRPAPTDEELNKVVSRLGAAPKDLAEHYGVPNAIISNWLYSWRKRQRALRGADIK